jgi:LacI family transcriptional regulator
MPVQSKRGNNRHSNLEDIARKAGVSRSTVSRVVNNDPNVKQSTRDRVMAIIEQEGFRPNLAARMLVTQRTMVIGIVIPHTLLVTFQDQYYFPTLLQGIAEATLHRDYATLLWWGQSHEHEEKFLQRILQQNRLVDGLIVASARTRDPLVHRLVQAGTPFVMVERPLEFADQISYVSVDNVAAAKTVIEHLYKHGRRRIGTITGAMDNVDAQDRLTGYRAGLESTGLPFDPDLIYEGQWTRVSGYLGAKHLLHSGVDAIFAANDVTAIGVFQAIQDAGLRIPDNVAVVGFDDLPNAVQVTPHLTTIRQPIQQKGIVATNLLIDLIEDKREGTQQLILPTQLIIRHSCGTLS